MLKMVYSGVVYVFVFVGMISCATKPESATSFCPPTHEAENPASRDAASVKTCSDLFANKRLIKFQGAEKIVDELPISSITEEFWHLVGQLSLNANSKITIENSGFVLNQNTHDGHRLQVSYTYDPVDNNFVATKVHYNVNGTIKESSLTDKSVNTDTEMAEFIKKQFKIADNTINLRQKISYKVFEKVRDQLPNLNLFSTHELLKISKMDHQARVAKYNAIVNTRKLKKFITQTLLDDFVYKPLRGFVISVLSIYLISSQLDIGKHLGITKDEVPNWVAPSIVSMASQQNPAIQKEAVLLMKLINSSSSKEPKDSDLVNIRKDSIKFNETDFYMIKKNKKDGRTYFVLTHENENGNLDVFFQEINPTQFKNMSAASIK